MKMNGNNHAMRQVRMNGQKRTFTAALIHCRAVVRQCGNRPRAP